MKLYGKNPVLERIRTSPGSIRGLYLQKRTDLSEVVKEAKKAGVEFKSVDKTWFLKECGDVHSQGVMAEVDEYEYASFGEIMADCENGSTVPVFLDGITDPQNLGAIIRNLACLGGFSLVLPEHRSAQVNNTVLRVANGGENYIKIAQVTNLATTLNKIREKGITVAGAVVEDATDILKADIEFPMVIVIGSEGKGIRPGVRKNLDLKLSLPMHGAPLSYNASVAASLFCYEINRRRLK
ncbi:MAG: 23S rRNA (guanosine(2251)-2'-O)-methyltransferase RlmB [Candidatus Omnitrophota bacterium]